MKPWSEWSENLVIAIGMAAGVALAAVLDWRMQVLQQRIVVGWCEYFTREAARA